jgi:hypothetical protein
VSLFGLALAKLLGLFGVGAGLLVVLYLLKLRRRRVEVPFAPLWQQVLGEKESTALLRRLRRWASLLLQLVFLALLVFALGDPRLGVKTLGGRSILLVVDTSASMKATDVPPSRMAAAREQARRVVRSLGGADQCMIVRLDGQPGPVTGFTGDGAALLRAVDDLAATDTPADLLGGLRFASDALKGRPRPELILVGDGAYPEDALRAVRWAPAADGPAQGASAPAPASAAASAGTSVDVLEPVDLGGVTASFVPIGQRGDNIGIVAFNVRRYPREKQSYEVFLEVQSFRDEPARVRLELLAAGGTTDLRTLTLPARGRVRQIYPDLASPGSRLEARLSRLDGQQPLDAFPLDDHAYALVPEERRLKVLLVSDGNLFLEGALLALGGGEARGLEYERVRPAAYAGTPPGYDLTIFDSFTPAAVPEAGRFLYLDPRGPGSPVPVRGEVRGPILTDLAKHVLTRHVVLTDTNISRASVFAARPGDTVVAASFRQPVIVARESRGLKLLVIGFDLRRSDLPMRPAFPILLANALDWFAGEDTEFLPSYKTGRTWSIAAEGADDAITIQADGQAPERAPVHDGRASYYGRLVGYYSAEVPRGRVALAANLADPAESAIRPTSVLVMGGRALGRPGSYGLSVRRDLWLYLLAAAFLLTLVEWWTYHRRITI